MKQPGDPSAPAAPPTPTAAPAPVAPTAGPPPTVPVGAERPPRGGRLVGRFGGIWQPVVGIAIFCGLALLAFGGTSPIGTTAMPMCACGDAAQEVWFIAWPAYAISHGLNPLYSNFIAYPHGINMMSSTSMPLLGLLASPVTLTIGPVAAFNLLVRLAFVLSATSMMLVLKRYVSWWPAAIAGGLLYGFSPFMLSDGFTHLFVTFLPLPPMVLLLLGDLLVQHRWPARRTGLLLGLVAAGQLLISAEILAITALVGLTGVVLLAIRHPVGARESLRQVGTGLAVASGPFAVLAAYPMWVYVAGPQHVTGPQHPRLTYSLFHNDLLGTVVPTNLERLGLASWIDRGNLLTQGNSVDHVSYLGVPLLVVLAYLIVRYRREGMIALAALLGAGALVLALGPTLYINGTSHLTGVRLPYDLLLHLPLLNGILAPRFVLVAFMFAAVIIGIGLDRVQRDGLLPRRASPGAAVRATSDPGRHAVRTASALVVALVALAPLFPAHEFASDPIRVPSFFRSAATLDLVPAGSVVLPYPEAQLPTVSAAVSPEVSSMLWQAVAGMRFRMIGAYAAQPSGSGLGQGDQLLEPPKVVQRLFAWGFYGSPAITPVVVTPAALVALRVFCARYDVSAILVDPAVGVHPGVVVSYVTRALGRPPRHLGGVDAWLAVNVGLAAGASSLAVRDDNASTKLRRVTTSATTAPDTTSTVPPTTTTVPPPTTTVRPGALPQTSAFPSAGTAAFRSEMRDLWTGIVTGRTAPAMGAFFPEAAYDQVKAIGDASGDWEYRLVPELTLDIAAAHDLLGAGARGAQFLYASVTSAEAAWIPPGYCYNKAGYWHAAATRLVYEEGGVTRSFGIASLISWRGVWYVAHLGAVTRPRPGGYVDDPTTGPGTPAPAGGC